MSAVNTYCSLTLPSRLADRLSAHLFPGDSNEHGAIIAAGVTKTSRGVRLLAKNLFPATDGIDYVAGDRGYRKLRAEFVTKHALYCRDNKLSYLAVHNHAGLDRVSFS